MLGGPRGLTARWPAGTRGSSIRPGPGWRARTPARCGGEDGGERLDELRGLAAAADLRGQRADAAVGRQDRRDDGAARDAGTREHDLQRAGRDRPPPRRCRPSAAPAACARSSGCCSRGPGPDADPRRSRCPSRPSGRWRRGGRRRGARIRVSSSRSRTRPKSVARSAAALNSSPVVGDVGVGGGGRRRRRPGRARSSATSRLRARPRRPGRGGSGSAARTTKAPTAAAAPSVTACCRRIPATIAVERLVLGQPRGFHLAARGRGGIAAFGEDDVGGHQLLAGCHVVAHALVDVAELGGGLGRLRRPPIRPPRALPPAAAPTAPRSTASVVAVTLLIQNASPWPAAT